MAKQFKRFGPLVVVLSLLSVVLIVPFVQSDPPPPEPPAEPPAALPLDTPFTDTAVLAVELRAAIGFGPTDVMPAMATDAEHMEVLDEAVAFATSIEPMAQELVATKHTAEQNLVQALTWGADEATVASAVAARDEAAGNLKTAAQGLIMILEGEIDAVDSTLCGTVDSNLKLDPPLRGLALTSSQRADLIAAHYDRDRVYKNALNWHNPVALEAADTALEVAISSVLTAEQLTELQAARDTIDARLDAMLNNEGEVADGQ